MALMEISDAMSRYLRFIPVIFMVIILPDIDNIHKNVISTCFEHAIPLSCDKQNRRVVRKVRGQP